MKKILLGALILSSCLISGCGYKYVKHVDCDVIEREYKASYITSMPSISHVGKINIITNKQVIHPEQWNVKLENKELKVVQVIDDKDLYNETENKKIVTLKLLNDGSNYKLVTVNNKEYAYLG